MILSAADFDRVRTLLKAHAGIELAPSKQQMAMNRLSRISRDTSEPVEIYLNRVEKVATEREKFINALTTNVTSFFRESHHFAHIERIARKVANPVIWSAGCSTGQEPYSLLFTLLEANPSLRSAKAPLLLATDIDTQVLATASLGKYNVNELKELNADRKAAYFDTCSDGSLQVKPALRRLVEFRQFNLSDAALKLPMKDADAIFCRNVMIYFSATTQRSIVQRFAQCLHAEGLLFTGHAEMLLHSENLFQSIGQTVYRKRPER